MYQTSKQRYYFILFTLNLSVESKCNNSLLHINTIFVIIINVFIIIISFNKTFKNHHFKFSIYVVQMLGVIFSVDHSFFLFFLLIDTSRWYFSKHILNKYYYKITYWPMIIQYLLLADYYYYYFIRSWSYFLIRLTKGKTDDTL